MNKPIEQWTVSDWFKEADACEAVFNFMAQNEEGKAILRRLIDQWKLLGSPEV